MKTLYLLLFIVPLQITSQSLSGEQLLYKSMAYHDSNGYWSTFIGAFNVTMETPNSSDRKSTIFINLSDEEFFLAAKRDTIVTEYKLQKDKCSFTLNGQSDISDELAETHRLSCERANMYKNYYTYLYGLPMKLTDPGTNVHDTVERKTFKGKDYLVLKVTYDEGVGSDIWYFYFNPETYAMEVYQFFKTDDSGNLKPDSGEYILLTGEEVISGIKMPKTRAWYYNKDDKYLGTDILSALKSKQ